MRRGFLPLLGLGLSLGLCGCPVTWPIPPDASLGGGAGGGNVGGGVGGGGGGVGGGGGGGGGVGGGSGNLAPHFDTVADLAIDEDTTDTFAVTGVTAGSPAEDLTQQVTLTATVADPSLLAVLLSGQGATRQVELVPLPNANGLTTLTLRADDGQGGTYAQDVHVTVNPVNDPPTVDTPGPQRVNAPSTLTVHLTGITPGGGPDEAGQPLTASVAVANPNLFTAVGAGAVSDGGCDLHFTPHPTNDGITAATVTVSDGQALHGTTQVQFYVMVNQTPPDVTALNAPSGTQSGCVPLTVTVADAKSLASDVVLEVNTGSGFRPGTLQLGSSTALSASPTGVQHTVVWRSNADVIDTSNASVQLRAFAARSGIRGNGSSAGPVAVDDTVSFQPHVEFTGGQGTFQAKPYDLDHDGWLDVVTADSFGDSVSVARGLPDGGFGPPVPFQITTLMCGMSPSKPFSVDIGDLDGDGREDLLSVQENCNTVGVVLGQPDGGFGPFSTVQVGVNPLFGTLGDFNHDGHLDYAVVNFESADVSVLLGLGNGGFLPETRVKVGGDPNKIEKADFDRDGNLDLVTANAVDNTISILLGDGDGGFFRRDFDAKYISPNNPDAGSAVRNLAVGDFNGDGLPDLAIANPGPNNDRNVAEVMLQVDAGWFGPPTPYITQNHPRSAGVGDFNLDGRPDFAIGNVNSDSVSVFINGGGGLFLPALNLPTGGGPHNVVPADADKDGRLDLFTGDTGISCFSVLRNTSPVCGP